MQGKELRRSPWSPRLRAEAVMGCRGKLQQRARNRASRPTPPGYALQVSGLPVMFLP